MLTQKLLEKDPSVQLVKPQKTSKSCAWSAECFLLVFYNNAKENFVYCQVCSNLITYNSIYGTGSLLRHICYKKLMKNESSAQMYHSSPKQQLKQLCIENDDGGASTSTDAMSLSMKCRDNSKQKKEIEELISQGDASFEMRAPGNTKSDVWRNGNFRVVYRDGHKLDFVMCLYCNSLITYKSKTGTASLLRHSCTKRMAAGEKSEPSHTITTVEAILHAPENELMRSHHVPENNAIEFAFVDSEADNEQYLMNEFSDDNKDEAVKLFYFFSCKDMQPVNLTQKKGFLGMAQYLINVGAKCGEVNAQSIFEVKPSVAAGIGDSFTNMLQNMLKPKLEDHKVSLSCDYWADNNRKLNYFTLYGHYISDAFELQKLNLGTVSFTADFTSINYKLLITSILEGYFSTDADIEAFLAKTTVVIFDEMSDCMKINDTITCAAAKLNAIMQTLIENYRELVPDDVLAAENWHHLPSLWEFLETGGDSMEAKTVADLKKILDPFTKALKSLCSDVKPTLNEVYIFRKKLEDHFKNHRSFTDGKVCDLALKLIREHFPMADIHKVAIFLDPRFKSMKFMTPVEKASVLASVSKMLNDKHDGDDGDNNSKPNRRDNKSNVLCSADDSGDTTKYLIEYMDFDEERDETHDEIETYMNLKFNDIYSTNILEFWESRYDLPQLRQLARETLSIPATGVVVEKHFNEEATILAKRRLNMEIDNIKQMLYIHENIDLLSNAVL